MSRPAKEIDWAKVDQLLISGCIGTEIAPHFDMHPETFYDRVKAKYGIGFTEYSTLKRQQGDSILRAKQYEKAMKLDNTMLIWLGKQRLGQKENHEKDNSPNDLKLDNLLDVSKLQYENQKLREELDALKSKAK